VQFPKYDMKILLGDSVEIYEQFFFLNLQGDSRFPVDSVLTISFIIVNFVASERLPELLCWEDRLIASLL
jgi:hypothetical protein